MNRFVIAEKVMRVGLIAIENPETSLVYKDESVFVVKTPKDGKHMIECIMEGFVTVPAELLYSFAERELIRIGSLNGMSYVVLFKNKHIFSVGAAYSDDEDGYLRRVFTAKEKIMDFINGDGMTKNNTMMKNLEVYLNRYIKSGREI